MADFEIPPRRSDVWLGRGPAPIAHGLKPGQFRAYCRSDLKAGHPPSQAWSGEVVQYSGQEQLALFADHFKRWHTNPHAARLTFKRPTKNAPWRAPKQKGWTPKPGDVGSDIKIDVYGLCQVWCLGEELGTVWVIPYDSHFSRALLIGRWNTVLRSS